MKMCVSEVWQKRDSTLAKFKRRWMMYCQENQWCVNAKVEEGCVHQKCYVSMQEEGTH
jgi:hypothetical protein